MGDRAPAYLGHDLGKQRGLIEASSPLPPPMQRHRHQCIRFCEQGAPGICHPATHHWGDVQAISIFEGMYECACDIVIADGRASAAIGGRIGDRFHGQETGTCLERERNAEPLTIRRGDERELRPARGTQATPLDRLAACGAKLRQRNSGDQIEY